MNCGDIVEVMLVKENLLSMSHNAMIPLPFLTASTEAEIVCIVDVKGNIRERRVRPSVCPTRVSPGAVSERPLAPSLLPL